MEGLVRHRLAVHELAATSATRILASMIGMRQGNMPMALLRLRMTKQKLTRDLDVNWRFYGDLPTK